jgi:hypothetical protein
MGKEKWIETRKEFTTKDSGDLGPPKIIHERDRSAEFNRKEILEIVFRSIAALAIAIPIMIFIGQRRAEIEKQKELFKFEVFTNTSTSFHTMLDSKPGSKEYNDSRAKLFYELYPKLLLINEPEIIRTYDELKDNLLVNEYNVKGIARINFSASLIIREVYTLLDSIAIVKSRAQLSRLFTNINNLLDQALDSLGQVQSMLDEYEFKQSTSKDSLKLFTENMFDYLNIAGDHILDNNDFYRIDNLDSIRRIGSSFPPYILINSDTTRKYSEAWKGFERFFKRNSLSLIGRFDSLIKMKSSYLY